MLSFLKKLFGTSQQRTINQFQKIVAEINRFDVQFQSLTDDELRAKTFEFKERYKKGESLDSLLPESYAVVKNVCRRLCGTEVHVSGYNQKWDMIPYDVQLIGAIALHKGSIAEMQTGEGKTLTACLPLYLNALTGDPVHIVTVNDYLVNRDCQWTGSIFRWLGLTTGVITQDVDYDARKEIYKSDIVYGTASEFGFDYLRDNSIATHKEEQVQRGFYFAIIDEVDSILIDEARTPLIISGPSQSSRQLYDVLKGPVSILVAKQKELCTKIALEAKKRLERHANTPEDIQKQFDDEDQKQLRNLWLVSKGMPHHKVLRHLREDHDIRASLDKWDLYFYSEQNKDEKAEFLSELYIMVDEKANEYELTDKGITVWNACGGNEDDFVMLDLGYEFALIEKDNSLSEEEKLQKKVVLQDDDALRKERAHNLRQLLRAHLLMEKDVDYIVQENKVIIIDENTGRPQPGRRYSDGLHQAIEAKEHVPIQKETQTVATITLQNYFRMYKKLSGMTGTAITEAQELKEIYKIDVLQIPTYLPCRRTRFDDEMYMTEREKYNAILKEVKEIHEQGRPILLGTESVEVSEKLSRIFKLNKLEHTVLNAKNHEKEAEIIALAGQQGSITIATNMAGRGTDIKLGQGIAERGGLHVIGSTRYQSRRIDRQLEGRSARMGDPGSCKSFISLEDPLMRLFASPAITSLLQRLRPPEGEPIKAKMLNRSIETAQKRVEGRNYTMRKHTLEYDDVMNKQRQEIYHFRTELISNEESQQLAEEVLENLCHYGVSRFFSSRSKDGGWTPQGFTSWLMHYVPESFDVEEFDSDRIQPDEIFEKANAKVQQAFKEKIDLLKKKTLHFEQNFQIPSEDVIDNAIRNILIKTIDTRWQEHLLEMDHLRQDVHLRVVGQKDPLMEFKHEAFVLFEQLSHRLLEQMTQALFKFDIMPSMAFQAPQMFENIRLETERSLFNDLEEEDEPRVEEINGDTSTAPFISEVPKAKRNDLCPCGSGKKYKKCCGVNQESEVAS